MWIATRYAPYGASWLVQSPVTQVPKSSGKHPVETSPGRGRIVFGRHKSHRGGKKSRSQVAEGKKPIPPTERTLIARSRSKSVKELCSARLGVIRVSNQSEHMPYVPLMADLTPLTHGTRVWLDNEASTKYVRDTQLPRLATDLYTLSSEILMDRAAKTMVLVSFISTSVFASSSSFFLNLPMSWYLDLEVKEDPFKELPEDMNVPMVVEQPVDGSPLPPEE
ncbi:hypothetical protein B296_00046253 [Ensete ventricosum]|uniref:Uncharacterized protein n=1 Tax=Ensete ventricosum TaxID=4639 RepID=A0A426Z4I3_ENSVE|nr:hypothetical protein B296_00046253 [Ensete ventricosum]